MSLFHPEKEFILKCLRDLIISDRSNDVGFLQNLDWDWIIETCKTHRIFGFVAFILKKKEAMKHLDHRVQEAFDKGQEQDAIAYRLKQQQFQEIMAILNKKGIVVIPLKGVALTYLIYENAPFRKMDDIDILVRPDDLNKVFDLLVKAGFHIPGIRPSKNRWQGEIWAETNRTWETINIGRIPLVYKDLELDLHYSPKYLIEQKYVEMDVEGMWQRARPSPQISPNAYMLAPNDQLLYLLLHTVDFFSPHLIQVLDIASVIEKCRLNSKVAFDQMNLNLPPTSKARLSVFLTAIQELIDINTDKLVASPETWEIFERFFSRTAISRAEIQEEDELTKEAVTGRQVFRNIRSPWKRAIFIAGYFLPNPDYYGNKFISTYYVHWRGLVAKICRFILGRRRNIHPDDG